MHVFCMFPRHSLFSGVQLLQRIVQEFPIADNSAVHSKACLDLEKYQRFTLKALCDENPSVTPQIMMKVFLCYQSYDSQYRSLAIRQVFFQMSNWSVAWH